MTDSDGDGDDSDSDSAINDKGSVAGDDVEKVSLKLKYFEHFAHNILFFQTHISRNFSKLEDDSLNASSAEK